MSRRVVRVLPEVFILLDEQLPDERGPNGEPTAAEFASSDLLTLVERFATRWDELPETIPGRQDYRILITGTRLVPFVSVAAQLSPVDGAVEIVDIQLDMTPPLTE